jgi:hypothetical protein
VTVPLLNELLDEAVGLCDALSTQAQAAATAGADASEAALALAQLAETEVEHLHGEIQHAVAALHEAADRTEAAVDHVMAALDSLPARTSETEALVRSAFDKLREEVLRLDEARMHLLEGLQAAAQAFDQDAETLGEHLRAYFTAIGDPWKKSVVGVRQITKDALDMRNHLDDRFALVRKDVQELGVVAVDEAQHFAAAMETGAQAISGHVTTALDEALHRHNALLQDLRAGVLDETASGVPDETWVETTFGELTTEIGYLEQVPTSIEQATAAPAGAIAESLSRASEQLEAAAGSLAKAHPH